MTTAQKKTPAKKKPDLVSKMEKIGRKYMGVGLEGHKELVDYYNKYCVPLVPKNRKYFMSIRDNWCAMFLSVLAHKAGIKEGDFPYEVSVYYMVEWARKQGTYLTGFAGVKVGDLVVYDWGSGNRFNHIGQVIHKDGRNLHVLEGNYRGSVGVRVFTPNRHSLKGYIALGEAKTGVRKQSLQELALATIRGEYGNGLDRERNLGNQYKEVQSLVSEMLRK